MWTVGLVQDCGESIFGHADNSLTSGTTLCTVTVVDFFYLLLLRSVYSKALQDVIRLNVNTYLNLDQGKDEET